MFGRVGKSTNWVPVARPISLVVRPSRQVVGCARLLRATGPIVMCVLFPDLEQTGLLRPHAARVESFRFCVDTSLEAGRAGGLHDITRTMFAAISRC